MEETNKYYTPEIEEFHIGFKFEVQGMKDNEVIWQEMSCGNFDALSLLDRMTKRVKYLDRQDIEELGWKSSGQEKELYSINWIENPTERKNAIWLKRFDNNRLQIIDSRHQWHISMFHGTIKNKSELKKLMKQLGICPDQKD